MEPEQPGAEATNGSKTRGDVVVSARHLWKVYGRGEAKARAALERGDPVDGGGIGLRDVSLEVHRGELLVVMGLSGSGKSTFIRCLNGLVESTSGTLQVLDTDLPCRSGAELRTLRSRIGMIFQSFGLLPHRTVLDNVGFGLEVRKVPVDERETRAREMVALVGLSGREESFPDELSGGQQQRVGLARALALDPHVLLMDEPFSALDALIREDLRREIRELQARLHKTIVLITHDLTDAVALGDRIAILHEGRLLQVGTAADICFSPADEIVERFVQHVDRLDVVRVAQAVDDGAGQRAEVTVPASAPLSEAVRLLGDPAVPAVLAVDGDGTPIGVVTAKSAMHAMAAQPATATAKEVAR